MICNSIHSILAEDLVNSGNAIPGYHNTGCALGGQPRGSFVTRAATTIRHPLCGAIAIEQCLMPVCTFKLVNTFVTETLRSGRKTSFRTLIESDVLVPPDENCRTPEVINA
ncbi:jg19848 [Pararge aegeria aegeria]|uniref:Jg19848 protein n=1 Tax=Pararge aegeria aegeria TaxID=348720 RepID=A0A8S4QIW1_9NEOP|nr:jg19848 [Pararge aegeria aegeria]